MTDQGAKQGARSPSEPEVPSRREAFAAAGASAIVVGVYVWVAWVHGAMGVPRNDDWVHYRIAYNLAEGGDFEVDGWLNTMFVGQALLAAPIVDVFGENPGPLQGVVAILAAAGLSMAYLVIRRFLSPAWSFLATSTLALGPVYASLAVSFMTDVPSFALQMAALLAGLRALAPAIVSRTWFAAALLMSACAFSVREYGAAAGVALCILAIRRVRSPSERSTDVVVLAACWFAVLAGVFIWRRGLPNSIVPSLTLSPAAVRTSVSVVWFSAITLSVFIFPAIVCASPTRLVRAIRTTTPATALVLLCSITAIATLWGTSFVGNYFSLDGSYAGTIIGSPPEVLSPRIWRLLEFLGVISLTLVGWLACLRLASRPTTGWSGAGARSAASEAHSLATVFFATVLLGHTAAVLFTDAPFFDRYLIVAVPFGAALVNRALIDEDLVIARAPLIAASALLGLGAIGFVFVDASATFDGGRWHLAKRLELLGYEASSIDGGYEWFGYHQADEADKRRPTPRGNFWVGLFSERPICVTLMVRDPQEKPPSDESALLIERIVVTSLTGVEYAVEAREGPDTCRG